LNKKTHQEIYGGIDEKTLWFHFVGGCQSRRCPYYQIGYTNAYKPTGHNFERLDEELESFRVNGLNVLDVEDDEFFEVWVRVRRG
ncbi:MAG: hypothetical protein AAF226_15785, partial [Verrucomicrobiota bacterium]